MYSWKAKAHSMLRLEKKYSPSDLLPPPPSLHSSIQFKKVQKGKCLIFFTQGITTMFPRK